MRVSSSVRLLMRFRSGQLTQRADGSLTSRQDNRQELRSGAPKEFTIVPNVAMLEPMSTLDVAVSLILT